MRRHWSPPAARRVAMPRTSATAPRWTPPRAVARDHGGIDIVCANAGIFPSASLEEIDGPAWDLVLNTNARGALYQACLPWLKQAEAGRVILTSSITGPVTIRVGALRGQQGGAAGFHAHRRAGTGAPRHHDQCGPARQRAHRGAERDGPGLPGTDDALGAAAASGQRARHRLGGAVPGLARGRLRQRRHLPQRVAGRDRRAGLGPGAEHQRAARSTPCRPVCPG